MNRPVLRLYGLVVVLFGVLVAFTSRWTVFEAEALRDNALNRRELLQEQKIRRGTIRSADGKVLARAVRREGDTFGRRYPTGELFAHAIGYSYTTIGRAGLERSRNDELTGRRTELVTAFESILGRSNEGDDIRTTLDSRARCRGRATRSAAATRPATCSRTRSATRTPRSGAPGSSARATTS